MRGLRAIFCITVTVCLAQPGWAAEANIARYVPESFKQSLRSAQKALGLRAKAGSDHKKNAGKSSGPEMATPPTRDEKADVSAKGVHNGAPGAKPAADTAPKGPAQPTASTPPPVAMPNSVDSVKAGEANKANAGQTSTEAPKADQNLNAKDKKAPETEWPKEKIASEKARCETLLKGLDVVAVPEAPFRNGACGAASPVRLISIGKKPELTISPPAILTCDMVAAMHTWVSKDLQPLAQRHLGAPLIQIEVMSDYACRAAYGRKGNALSEHALANALDIRGFTTSDGKQAILLNDWGATLRDIAARAKAESEAALRAKAEAAKAEAAKNAPPVGGNGNGVSKPVLKATEQDDIPVTNTSLAPPLPIIRKANPKVSAFLRDAHKSACNLFGTTLGPETNEAHRNHFHVDMAERKFKRICE